MASGGGLYLTACFATAIILIALELLGHLEGAFSLKTILTTYEVSGRSADSMLREVNRILDTQQLIMQSVHMAGEPPEVRVVFTLDCDREEQNVFSVRLHESNVFTNVSSLGTAERE
jgi:uncharacterized membrane protein YhiD involved in acid resistance